MRTQLLRAHQPALCLPGPGDAAQSLGELLPACCDWEDVKEVMPHKAPVNKTELIISEKSLSCELGCWGGIVTAPPSLERAGLGAWQQAECLCSVSRAMAVFPHHNVLHESPPCMVRSLPLLLGRSHYSLTICLNFWGCCSWGCWRGAHGGGPTVPPRVLTHGGSPTSSLL